MQHRACETFADRKVFGTRVGSQFEWITYKELGHRVQLFRNVLHKHNIGKNDKVALISNNRVEWAVAFYAVASLGGQLVPMYEAQLEKDWQFIIKDSGAKMLLVGPDHLYTKTKDYPGQVGNIQSVLCFDSSPEYLHSYQRWLKQAETEEPVPAVHLTPQDHLVLIYTSGTTGNPKGVTLSHENAVTVLKGLSKMEEGILDDHTSLAFLPWAHVFGQNTELHALIANGSAMGIVSQREQLIEGITLVKPSLIFAVPQLFNRVYDGIMKKISEGSAIEKAVFKFAMAISRRRNSQLESGKSVSWLLAAEHSLVDKVVFSKIREKLGGNIRFMGSGGAAVSVPVLQFFEDIGIPVCEGYGLTETAPIITFSKQGWTHRRLGCVGVPIDGVEVRIVDPETLEEKKNDEDGEITCSGPNVMVGYHNNPKADAEVFFYKDGKRFFRTGDMGRMVEGKFLKITGRIKEQFKLVNGKYVVPAPLEDALTRSQFIAQSFLYGDNRAFTVALIVPDFVELKAWAAKQAPPLPVDDLSALVNSDAVKKLLTDEVVSASAVMKSFERPRVWSTLTEPFSQENQMLTPKMSLRRNNVLKTYSEQVEAMYAGKLGVHMPKIAHESNEA